MNDCVKLTNERAAKGLFTLPTNYNRTAFIMNGDSMNTGNAHRGDIKSGDLLHCEHLPTDKWRGDSKIDRSGCWVIELANGTTIVRRILQHDAARKLIVFHAFNNAIPDAEIFIDDIKALHYITHVSYDAAKRFSEPVSSEPGPPGASFKKVGETFGGL